MFPTPRKSSIWSALTTSFFFNAVDHKAAFDRLHDALTERPAHTTCGRAQVIERTGR